MAMSHSLIYRVCRGGNQCQTVRPGSGTARIKTRSRVSLQKSHTQINAMVVPWVATTSSGMLVMKGRRVRQGRLAGIFESADEAETQVEIGRKAAHVAFDLLLGDAQLIESEAPAHVLLLLAFTAAACRPTGCNLATLLSIERVRLFWSD